MNQENLEYLKKSLHYTGFGESLNAELEKNVANGVSSFILSHSAEYSAGKMLSSLHFSRDNQHEPYLFNKYDSVLVKPDGTQVEQTFNILRTGTFTTKEAYNFLDGRSIYKEFETFGDQKYHAWVKLDPWAQPDVGGNQFRWFHGDSGYDLMKALEKFPIGELKNDKEKEALVKSLETGNLQQVCFDKGGVMEKRLIAADPECRGIKVYDQSMKEITNELENGRQQRVNPRHDSVELQKNRTGKSKGLSV